MIIFTNNDPLKTNYQWEKKKSYCYLPPTKLDIDVIVSIFLALLTCVILLTTCEHITHIYEIPTDQKRTQDGQTGHKE